MTDLIYNEKIHRVYICGRCQGKRIVDEESCEECLGLGFKVYRRNVQVHDHNTALFILITYMQQQGIQKNKESTIPTITFEPSTTKQYSRHPHYNPLEDPLHPINPNNPVGWLHPSSPNNPLNPSSPFHFSRPSGPVPSPGPIDPNTPAPPTPKRPKDPHSG
jgi:hypothetical protein